jgi:hypothetical protein
MICIPLPWIVLMWILCGVLGLFNALERMYGGIRPGLRVLGGLDSYHLGVACLGGPVTILLSLNPWLPRMEQVEK